MSLAADIQLEINSSLRQTSTCNDQVGDTHARHQPPQCKKNGDVERPTETLTHFSPVLDGLHGCRVAPSGCHEHLLVEPHATHHLDLWSAFNPGANNGDLVTARHQLVRAVRHYTWSPALQIGVVVLRGDQHMHSLSRITKPGAEAPGR